MVRFNTDLPNPMLTAAESLLVLRGNGGASVVPNSGTCFGQTSPNLLLEHFFYLPDFPFNFAGPVFGFAFSL
jgi:hypothetical protein